MIPETHGYARVSKTDRDEKNLETQFYVFDKYGLLRDLIFVVDETGTTFKCPGWKELMERVHPGDTMTPSSSGRTGSAGTSRMGWSSRRT